MSDHLKGKILVDWNNHAASSYCENSYLLKLKLGFKLSCL